jgi:uncharacterized membrane protein
MNLDWLKSLAPLLGTAIGGPLGGVAASFIADKLGIPEKTIDAVTTALASGDLTPEQISSLKAAELEFQRFCKQNEVDIQALHNANTKDARGMQIATQSSVPGILAVIIVVGFFGVLIGMMFGWLKVSDQQALLILLGALAAGFGSVLNYYYGSSKASDDRSFIRITSQKPNER